MASSLLESKVLTSVIKDFQNCLLIDVKSTDVDSNNVNISFVLSRVNIRASSIKR